MDRDTFNSLEAMKLISTNTVQFKFSWFKFTNEEVDNIYELRKSFQVSDIIATSCRNEIYEINTIFVKDEDRRKGYASKVLQDFCSNKDDVLIIIGAGALDLEYPEEPIPEEYDRLFNVLDTFYTSNNFEDVTQLFGTYDGTTKRTYLCKNTAGLEAIEIRNNELEKFRESKEKDGIDSVLNNKEELKMKTKIVAGFPGTGKSLLFKEFGADKVADSDSSSFSWIIEDGERKRNPEFPDNYIKHIQSLMGKVNIICVSTHDVVRNALKENNMWYILVYPDRRCKDIYLQNYKTRGNAEAFVDLMDKNWDKFLDEVEAEELPDNSYKVRLLEHVYIKDIPSVTKTLGV